MSAARPGDHIGGFSEYDNEGADHGVMPDWQVLI